MKLEITKEWCLAAARREGDVEVGAGRLAFDPKPEIEGTTSVQTPSFDTKPKIEGATNVQTPPVEAMQLAFGKLINFMRRKERWTIEDLAKRAKVDPAELLLIEKEVPHQTEPYTVYQLASVFHLNAKALQQLSGLAVVRNHQVVDEAVRFAANSDSIEKLSPEQTRSVEQFVAALNRLADGEKASQ
jgi:transcriptional regulator with XRE-family HTH domain